MDDKLVKLKEALEGCQGVSFPNCVNSMARSRISEAYSMMLEQLSKIEMEEMQVRNATTRVLADELQARSEALTWRAGVTDQITDLLEVIKHQTTGETGPARIIIVQE